jgi:GH15 family glucan-1,4-alpha-glucosidase
LLCTFWLADNLALQGRQDDARAIFERLLQLRNDVGLLSEMYSPQHRRLLGNFPQAFSHVGLVNTARNLTEVGGPAEHRSGKPDA